MTVCGSSITVKGASGNLHIEEDKTQMRLYVPEDEDDREICYLSRIPETLVTHLVISDPAAVKVIGDIIQASRPPLMDRLLEIHGIISIPGIENAPLPSIEEPPLQHPERSISGPPSASNQQSPSESSTLRIPSTTPTLSSHVHDLEKDRDSPLANGRLTPGTASTVEGSSKHRSIPSPEQRPKVTERARGKASPSGEDEVRGELTPKIMKPRTPEPRS